MALISIGGRFINPEMIEEVEMPNVSQSFPDYGEMVIHMANGNRILLNSIDQLKQGAKQSDIIKSLYDIWNSEYDRIDDWYGDYQYDMLHD